MFTNFSTFYLRCQKNWQEDCSKGLWFQQLGFSRTQSSVLPIQMTLGVANPLKCQEN